MAPMGEVGARQPAESAHRDRVPVRHTRRDLNDRVLLLAPVELECGHENRLEWFAGSP